MKRFVPKSAVTSAAHSCLVKRRQPSICQLWCEEVVDFGRSWAYAPEIEVSEGFESIGYDRSERIYQIKTQDARPKTQEITINVKGTSTSPIQNPAFYIKNWNGDEPKVYVNGKEYSKARVGMKYELDGTDLIVYLPLESTKELMVEIK